MGNYNKFPEIRIEEQDNSAWQGYAHIQSEISQITNGNQNPKTVLMVDCYPGVRYQEILEGLILPLKPDLIIHSDDLAFSGEKITEMIQRNLTDDRVFGVMSSHQLCEFFDRLLVEHARESIGEVESGLIVVYGVGARLICIPDVLVYADLARWEIQQRYRSQELGNWKMENFDEDFLRKYKRSYFVEWRIADRHKKQFFSEIDYLLDTNETNDPKMLKGQAYLNGLQQVVKQPFRVVPYFDPGVWGGQWMKEVCDLDPDQDNFAWSFDGVPEENSLYLRYDDVRVEVPSINLVFRHPVELLGDKVHARFGTEFPIRFDFLDTVDGQNLSLQVHPLTEYIQETFGMHYTQDESYYILDAKEEATVYLGLKENINKEAMLEDLKKANHGLGSFDDEKYVSQYPAKKHDHFLIPAGTIHCSGKNCMILEISATPYIFTFKLWDWDRLGLDGLPRPVHLKHGEKVIQWDRDTKWVKENLINRIEIINEEDGWIQEKTGLHEREFIETRRHWFSKKIHHHTNGSVHVLNLIEGEEAIIESPTGQFNPFIVHYAETFFIPEDVKEYTIRPYGKAKGKTIAVIQAFVRV
ncbi:class I mannose-6-phosphate isomerase [Fictibacillus terranigra]|uniref:Class I mannose-6-phosphate isomerase n=1 Tax=Fictibacillus terranigra TaxID=3058424 RepID=A0ABT8EDU5_9BACL|nr:class I mannose-6-phosphate isomerase [Fictibacillus sp. CENA-BCM004]MDN4075982.1 class I mannose-6-phosphate isomerase [Fictibacillus sp. CENA-BCM004]